MNHSQQGRPFVPYGPTHQPPMPHYQLPPANVYEPVHVIPQAQTQLMPQQQAFRRASELCVTCGGIRHTAKTCPINIRARKDTITRVADELGQIIKDDYELFKHTKFLAKLEELLECHAHRCYYHTSPLLTQRKKDTPTPTETSTEVKGRIE